jgi:hypothetical protein
MYTSSFKETTMGCLEVFDRVWDLLASRGHCDARGGMEYHRVKKAWQCLGGAENAYRFILAWANMDADGRPAEVD